MICNKPLRVFDDQVIKFLGDLSAELFKSPLVHQYPDLSAFAFYIRKANLLKLRSTLFPATQSPDTPSSLSCDSCLSWFNQELSSRLGRGLCFHIAPANIPVNFAFTWVFSLLAGNANIVRLPSKDFPQVDALLTVIKAHLARYPELETRNLFVKYPRTDNETTATYCQVADCRMIWGGDRTIASIKALPTKPRCVDICFADRYSVALINAEAVMAADETQLARLAEGFYNDTYLMDQNACSSPQVILWEVGALGSGEVGELGSGEVGKAREKFWKAVEDVAKKKYVLQDAVAVDKYTLFCEEAVNNSLIKRVCRSGNLLYRIELKALSAQLPNSPTSQLPNFLTSQLPNSLTSHRGKAGFFFEYVLKDREEFFSVVTEKFQTITQFGIDASELAQQIAAAHLRGIDRIVPIGKAMDIGVVWDGHDLIRELSRVVAQS